MEELAEETVARARSRDHDLLVPPVLCHIAEVLAEVDQISLLSGRHPFRRDLPHLPDGQATLAPHVVPAAALPRPARAALVVQSERQPGGHQANQVRDKNETQKEIQKWRENGQFPRLLCLQKAAGGTQVERVLSPIRGLAAQEGRESVVVQQKQAGPRERAPVPYRVSNFLRQGVERPVVAQLVPLVKPANLEAQCAGIRLRLQTQKRS